MTKVAHGRALDLRGRILDLHTPRIMGVINLTPDSFYPQSRHGSARQARDTALAMVDAGADMLDLGAMSSRPGAEPVPVDVEIERLLPALEAVRAAVDIPLSVDTFEPEVAQRAIGAGADVLNDITGLRDSDELARLAAASDLGIIVMHMRGEPRTMQRDTRYGDLVTEVEQQLAESARLAIEAGVAAQRVIIDPGIGFGKSAAGNVELLAHLGRLRALGYPLLVGASRKSFLGALLGTDVEERLPGSLAAAVAAVLGGADIVRVHDVPETVQAVRLAGHVRAAQTSGPAVRG